MMAVGTRRSDGVRGCLRGGGRLRVRRHGRGRDGCCYSRRTCSRCRYRRLVHHLKRGARLELGIERGRIGDALVRRGRSDAMKAASARRRQTPGQTWASSSSWARHPWAWGRASSCRRRRSGGGGASAPWCRTARARWRRATSSASPQTSRWRTWCVLRGVGAFFVYLFGRARRLFGELALRCRTNARLVALWMSTTTVSCAGR